MIALNPFGIQAEVPKKLLDKIFSTMPQDGIGTRDWLFCICLLLGRLYPDRNQLYQVLDQRTKSTFPPVTAMMLGQSIRDADAYRHPTKYLRPRYLVPRWPETLEKGLATGPDFKGGLEELKKLAPVSWPDEIDWADFAVYKLLPGDCRIMCGNDRKDLTFGYHRQAWGMLERMQFLVPSALADPRFTPPDHFFQPVDFREYLVLRFPGKNLDEQSRSIMHMSKLAPLVAVVDDTEGTPEAWFSAAYQTHARLRQFFDYALILGADKATWSPYWPARMPAGHNQQTQKTQELLYLNGGIFGERLYM